MTDNGTPDRTASFDTDISRFRHEYPAFDYTDRVAELAARLVAHEADAAVIPHFIDLVYYTGSGQPANLYVPAGTPGGVRHFVRRAMGFARQESGLPEDRVVLGGLSALGDHAGEVDTLGLPLDVIPAGLASKIQSAVGAAAWVDVSDLILTQRAVKDPGEVDLIERGAGLYDAAHTAIRETAAPGETERSVGAAVAQATVDAGMESRVFFRRWDARLPASGLIVSGETLPLIAGHAMTVTGVGTSRTMPWGPSNNQIDEGDFLVADLALNYAGYHGDIARTYVIGSPTPAQREWFDLTLGIHTAAREVLDVGVAAETPYLAALEYAKEHGVADWLCGYGEMQAAYVGHSIGLETDEEPTLRAGNRRELEPGMVVTIEPKLIHPDRGAVMIEDDYLITDEGPRRLGSVPLDLFSIPV